MRSTEMDIAAASNISAIFEDETTSNVQSMAVRFLVIGTLRDGAVT